MYRNLVYFFVATLSSSFLSGLAGVGGGVLLFSLMMTLFPISIIIPLHGTIQLLSNISRVIISYKYINYKIFIFFTLGSFLGALSSLPFDFKIDSFNFTYIICTFILLFTWAPFNKIDLKINNNFFEVGAIATFLSIFIGSTGPLTAPFFLNSELDKTSFVPTKSACQIPIHLFKVIIYLLSGFILYDYLIYIIIAIPTVVFGAKLGKIMSQRIKKNNYFIFIKLIISLLVLRMILKELNLI